MSGSAAAGAASSQRGRLLVRLHGANALFIIVFLLMHLITHVSGVFGADAYNAVQGVFQTIYRNRVVEPVLLVSMSAQLVLGAILLIGALRRGIGRGFWPRVQVISGGFFLVFMVQHLFSLGMVRLYFNLETDFHWPASVMAGPPFIYYFAPYYFLGVWAVLAHIGVAARYRLLAAGREALANRTGWGFIAGGAAVSAFILPILSGAWLEIEFSQDWIDYLRFYDPGFELPGQP